MSCGRLRRMARTCFAPPIYAESAETFKGTCNPSNGSSSFQAERSSVQADPSSGSFKRGLQRRLQAGRAAAARQGLAKTAVQLSLARWAVAGLSPCNGRLVSLARRSCEAPVHAPFPSPLRPCAPCRPVRKAAGEGRPMCPGESGRGHGPASSRQRVCPGRQGGQTCRALARARPCRPRNAAMWQGVDAARCDAAGKRHLGNWSVLD